MTSPSGVRLGVAAPVGRTMSTIERLEEVARQPVVISGQALTLAMLRYAGSGATVAGNASLLADRL